MDKIRFNWRLAIALATWPFVTWVISINPTNELSNSTDESSLQSFISTKITNKSERHAFAEFYKTTLSQIRHSIQTTGKFDQLEELLLEGICSLQIKNPEQFEPLASQIDRRLWATKPVASIADETTKQILLRHGALEMMRKIHIKWSHTLPRRLNRLFSNFASKLFVPKKQKNKGSGTKYDQKNEEKNPRQNDPNTNSIPEAKPKTRFSKPIRNRVPGPKKPEKLHY